MKEKDPLVVNNKCKLKPQVATLLNANVFERIDDARNRDLEEATRFLTDDRIETKRNR